MSIETSVRAFTKFAYITMTAMGALLLIPGALLMAEPRFADLTSSSAESGFVLLFCGALLVSIGVFIWKS